MPLSRTDLPVLPPRRRWLTLNVFVVSLLAAIGAKANEIDFDSQIAPIFAGHCLECHSGIKPKGDLALTSTEDITKGGASGQPYVAKDSSKSLLWERVSTNEMPPKHALKVEQKEILKRWIDEGAKWGTSPIDRFAVTTSSRAGRDWWSLQPLEAEPPKTDIDASVRAKLQDAGLKLAKIADPRTLIRRLYFDLIGLPPSPAQVDAFVASPTLEAYENIVAELLASKHYGERWGRHWLDVVRFGESDGFERNMPRKTAWHYRDWVVKALNDNMPYDEFVRMQLIGDLLQDGPDGAAATGFWVAGVHNTVVGGSQRMKLLARQDEIEEVLATVGQTFVGLTVNCARCHDHKFDPIRQKEFYQMASAISGLGYGERVVKTSVDAAKLADIEKQLGVAHSKLSAIDSKARVAIIAARKKGEFKMPDPPVAFARWEFDRDLKDSIGNLHGTAIGGARVENGALVVDGTSFVETIPLNKDIQQKTLEAWVLLDNLEQRGGGAISIETRSGVIFDSIVFGEREPKRWMAGSNGFVRTDSFQAPEESEATKRPVHFALVYTKDGTITGYRDGKPYGRSIRKAALQDYKAGDTEIVFGLRHKPAGSSKHLKAKIHKAAFYNRALTAEEVAASSGNSAEYVPDEQIVEWLPEDKRHERATFKQQIAELAKSRDALNAKANPSIYTLTPGGGAKTNVLVRGDPEQLGDVVSPGAVAAVAGVDANFSLSPEAPEADRRRKLATWITDRNNPLFARVIVNRVWHYHFGTGLVDTPNDFGFNGGRPTHPELLDWLAATFRNDGYNLKNLHRMIVMSDTWKQAGYLEIPVDAKNPNDIDAHNRLLWRATPRRLDAESVRDAMLAVAGKLNDKLGGPSFEDVTIIGNNGTTYYEPKDVEGDAFNRRTIYRFNPRGGRTALLDTFDCPDPATAAPRRAITTTPLQALSLLNNAFVLRMSDAFADRLTSEAGNDVPAQITLAWRLALSREPTEIERRLSEELTKEHGLAALCRGLFNTNEFVVAE
ncbi:MAG: DUF1553 domain-containing protein [Planctomycetes bacterium]|nr:DUF1553 domain-containing protein [Planctomycetota bacterium]